MNTDCAQYNILSANAIAGNPTLTLPTDVIIGNTNPFVTVPVTGTLTGGGSTTTFTGSLFRDGDRRTLILTIPTITGITQDTNTLTCTDINLPSSDLPATWSLRVTFSYEVPGSPGNYLSTVGLTFQNRLYVSRVDTANFTKNVSHQFYGQVVLEWLLQ